MIKEPRFSWKRETASTGKWSWLDNNSLRGYNCKVLSLPGYVILDQQCGFLSNVSQSNQSKDQSEEWQIYFTAKEKNGNICLKKRFKLEEVELAKKYFEGAFVRIMTTDMHEDMKQSILKLGRIKPIE